MDSLVFHYLRRIFSPPQNGANSWWKLQNVDMDLIHGENHYAALESAREGGLLQPQMVDLQATAVGKHSCWTVACALDVY